MNDDEIKKMIYDIYDIARELYNNYYNDKLFKNNDIYSLDEYFKIDELIEKLKEILKDYKNNGYLPF